VLLEDNTALLPNGGELFPDNELAELEDDDCVGKLLLETGGEDVLLEEDDDLELVGEDEDRVLLLDDGDEEDELLRTELVPDELLLDGAELLMDEAKDELLEDEGNDGITIDELDKGVPEKTVQLMMKLVV
jgi:hypothetical protein